MNCQNVNSAKVKKPWLELGDEKIKLGKVLYLDLNMFKVQFASSPVDI